MTTTKKTQTKGDAPATLSHFIPSKVKAFLDKRVIGQEEAKKTLAVAVYNHMKRTLLRQQGKDTHIRKSNVILMGSTGCGKTWLVRSIAEFMHVPFYIQDCTKITASGYVGSDVEDCLAGLLRACDYDVASAERGIVVLDELDKNAVRSAGPSITRDVSGECVQQSLLKIVEGDVVGVPPQGGRKHPEQPLIRIDTSDILFIATGAFVGMEDIVGKRLGTAGKIGFGRAGARPDDGRDILDSVSPQDLRDFGMIPELVGRFPVVTHVNSLGKDDLVRILKEPEFALVKEYKELLRMDGIELVFDDSALEFVAEQALSMGTGVRGLRGILETFMRDVMFEAPDLQEDGLRKIRINRKMVEWAFKGKDCAAV